MHLIASRDVAYNHVPIPRRRRISFVTHAERSAPSSSQPRSPLARRPRANARQSTEHASREILRRLRLRA
jgi:hypothetical protein